MITRHASFARLGTRTKVFGLVATLAAGIGLAGCGNDTPTTHAMGSQSHVEASTCKNKGTIRRHFVAAEEVTWDYAPAGTNLITGTDFTDDENVFVAAGPDRNGSKYLKSQYLEYTDATFADVVPAKPEWEHLGILGPMMHAEVGDTIVVEFKNNTSKPASMHPHGVFYGKDSEGAGYADGTNGADTADDAVAPGATHTYTWEVPERAAPGPMEGSSTMWMYHSHVDEAGDTNAGLMGPMVVTRCGQANPDGSPKDVDREFVVNFAVMDENASIWSAENLAALEQAPDPEDEEFEESNLMHAINGYVYGNLPGLTMKKGENVRWYVMAMGTEVDLHTPHWHGGTVIANGMRADVVAVLPAQMLTADFVPDNPGIWFFHCHVNDHITAGMQSLFTIKP